MYICLYSVELVPVNIYNYFNWNDFFTVWFTSTGAIDGSIHRNNMAWLRELRPKSHNLHHLQYWIQKSIQEDFYRFMFIVTKNVIYYLYCFQLTKLWRMMCQIPKSLKNIYAIVVCNLFIINEKKIQWVILLKHLRLCSLSWNLSGFTIKSWLDAIDHTLNIIFQYMTTQ